MTTITRPIPERLILLPEIKLDEGSHPDFEAGHCINEVAAWLVGEPHTDRSRCVSPVLRKYTMPLNDRWNDQDRQALLPYAEKIVGTAGDGQDRARVAIAQAALTVDLLPPWLRLAGLDERADKIAGMRDAPTADLRRALRRAAGAAWVKRSTAWAGLRERIKAKLLEQGMPDATAAADAGAGAAVAAAAAAAAVTTAVADVAAGAVSAVDVAAAAAAAAAAAVAADAAVSAAGAVAAVVDAVAAGGDIWGAGYEAAYKFWDDWFANNPSHAAQQIRTLAAEQRKQALVILDRMINPAAVTA